MKWFDAGTKKNECLNIRSIHYINQRTMYKDMRQRLSRDETHRGTDARGGPEVEQRDVMYI